MNAVNLNALAVKRHVVEYDDGKGVVKHWVGTMTWRIANVIDAAEQEADGRAKMAGYHDAIELILPTMPRKIIEGLEAPMMQKIFELSRDQINTVQEAAAAPNVDSPAPAKKLPSRRARTLSAAL